MICPMYDNVLIQIQEQTNTTESGIILVTAQKEKKDIGRVAKTGEGRLSSDGKLTPLRVREGDSVLFNRFAGTEIEYDNKLYVMIREADILAIIR